VAISKKQRLYLLDWHADVIVSFIEFMVCCATFSISLIPFT